jgi:ribosomal protein L23
MREKQKELAVIVHPLITEKAVGMIESENKLCFVVSRGATRQNVRETVEKEHGVKVDSVRILNDRKGRKKAIVKINKQFKADEIATKRGVL